MKNNCRYCKNKATKRYSPDLDIKGISICDDEKCFIKYFMAVNPKEYGNNK